MFMLVAFPFRIAIGFVFPTNQSLVSYTESKTNKINTSSCQACMSMGSLYGTLVAAYVIKKDIDFQVTFAEMGIITLLSAIIFYFLGMPRAEESNNLVDKFKILEK